MVKLVKPLQSLKAERSIEVTLEGIIRLVKPLQPSKAHKPIEVTLEGIVTLVKTLQPLKTELPNSSLEPCSQPPSQT